MFKKSINDMISGASVEKHLLASESSFEYIKKHFPTMDD